MEVWLANGFVRLAELLDNTLDEAKEREGELLSRTERAALKEGLKTILGTCEASGWESTADQARRILLMLQAGKVERSEFLSDFFDLRRRFSDDLGHYLCLVLSRDRARFWENPQLFGSEVFEGFPEATLDIEEAGKCLACHRGTATVFHLMRVMEVGLKVTAKALGVPYAPSWESYLSQIQSKIDMKWRKKGVRWKRDEPFFRDVLVHLQAVKVAWRNPTMHIVRHYTPDQAEEVFNAVRGFMRVLAARLSKKEAAE